MNCSKTFIKENKEELKKTKFKIPLYVYKFNFSDPKEFLFIFLEHLELVFLNRMEIILNNISKIYKNL